MNCLRECNVTLRWIMLHTAQGQIPGFRYRDSRVLVPECATIDLKSWKTQYIGLPFGSSWSVSVSFGPFWLLLVPLVHLGPFWSLSWYPLVALALVPLVPLGTFWSLSVYFWSIMVPFGRSCFWFLLFLGPILAHFGPFWSLLVTLGYFWYCHKPDSDLILQLPTTTRGASRSGRRWLPRVTGRRRCLCFFSTLLSLSTF